LPELPLERTLSRKSVLCQVRPLISGNETRLDLSTPDPGAPIDGLAIDDQALFIIQQLASLLTRRASAFLGFHFLHVVLSQITPLREKRLQVSGLDRPAMLFLDLMSCFRPIGTGTLIRTRLITVESGYARKGTTVPDSC
jgi:hypothetical protein